MSEGPFNVLFVGGSLDGQVQATSDLPPVYQAPTATGSLDWDLGDATKYRPVVEFGREEYRLEQLATKTSRFYLYLAGGISIDDALNRILSAYVKA